MSQKKRRKGDPRDPESELPPEDETQPTAAERQVLVNALTAELRRAMEAPARLIA